VAVYQVQVVGVQALQTPVHAFAHPGCGVIKFFGLDAPHFREDQVRVAGKCLAHEGRRQRFAEKLLRGAIVGGGVEGADAMCER
jgi:hypothetical protein